MLVAFAIHRLLVASTLPIISAEAEWSPVFSHEMDNYNPLFEKILDSPLLSRYAPNT